MKVAACVSYIPVTACFSTGIQPLLKLQKQLQQQWDKISFDAFNALECTIWLKSLGKWYRLFYWNIMFCLDTSHHMTKYLFFQWLDCLHIEIGSIWLSHWRYQLRICQSANFTAKHSDHNEPKSLTCCQLSWRSTSISNWYSAIVQVAGVLCAWHPLEKPLIVPAALHIPCAISLCSLIRFLVCWDLHCWSWRLVLTVCQTVQSALQLQ